MPSPGETVFIYINHCGSPLFRVREKQKGAKKFSNRRPQRSQRINISFLPIAIRRLLIDDCLIAEPKAVEKVLAIHQAQLLGCWKLLDKPPGLLISFHESVLKNGIHRLVLGHCAAS
jgi:hypothetical protein